MSFENVSAALLPNRTNGLAPRQGLVFDGTNVQPFSTLSSAIGTSAITWSQWLTIPVVSGNFVSLGGISTNTAYLANGSAFTLTLQINGALRVTIPNATNNGGVYADVSGISAFSSKTILLTVTRSGSTLAVYFNGIAQTVTPVLYGTSPGDFSNTISGTTIALGGQAGSSGAIFNGYSSGPNLYNRALSATEVVSLYESGVPSGADYSVAVNGVAAGGNLLTSGVWSSGGTGITVSSTSNTGFTASGTGNNPFAGGVFGQLGSSIVARVGMKYRATWTYTAVSGETPTVGLAWDGNGVWSNTVSATAGSAIFTVTANQNAAKLAFLTSNGAATSYSVSGITMTPLGLLLAPDAAQAGGGLVWYDTSGNAANITLPASGVTWNVPTSGVLGGNFRTAGNLNASNGFYVSGSAVSPNNTASVDVSFQGTYGKISAINRGVGNFPLSLQPEGGNLLIGTTTDSGNGKLQLATHTTSAGGIGFGTDVSLFRSATGVLRLASTSNYLHEIVNTAGTSAATTVYSNTGGSLFVGIDSASGGAIGGGAYAGVISRDGAYPLTLRTNGATALTLASNQAATFAGAVTVGGKITSSVSTATGYNQLYDTTGITTGRGAFAITSTGAGLAFGVESSVGGTSFTGSTAYASYFGTTTATPIHFVTNSVIRQTISSTGAATFAGDVTRTGSGDSIIKSVTTGTTSHGKFNTVADVAQATLRTEGSATSGTLFSTNRASATQLYSESGPLVLGAFGAYSAVIGTNNVARLTIDSTGAATFAGAVSAGGPTGLTLTGANTSPSLSGPDQAQLTGVALEIRRGTGEGAFNLSSADGTSFVSLRRLNGNNSLDVRAGATVLANFATTGTTFAGAVTTGGKLGVGTAVANYAGILNGLSVTANSGLAAVYNSSGAITTAAANDQLYGLRIDNSYSNAGSYANTLGAHLRLHTRAFTGFAVGSGLEIGNITGAAANFAIRSGSGIVSFGDTTPSTGAGSGALQVAGGIYSGAASVFGGTVAISGGIVGTTTNNNAAAGIVGEIVVSTVDSGSGVSLTSAVVANATSITLTAGDWDVTGVVGYDTVGATVSQFLQGTNNASGSLGPTGTLSKVAQSLSGDTNNWYHIVPTYRFSLSGTSTVYLLARATFSAGTVSAFGAIRARRAR